MARKKGARSPKKRLTFHVVTLFPEALSSYLSSSILGRAIRDGFVDVRFYDPKSFAKPASTEQRKRARPFVEVDDTPFGGGPGMVMKAEPVLRAVAAAKRRIGKGKARILFFHANGAQFSNADASRIAADAPRHIILICGRYEGIDARVEEILRAERVSVGPYILTGGEIPALIVMDAAARHIPGVLGDIDSIEERRTAGEAVYTRPAVISHKGRRYKVPEVLLSGDHARIERWKKGLDA